MIVNAMTVDVEDYFQVSAFEKSIDRADWDKLPCRVEANTDAIIEMFDQHNVHATFFMLGWVAERYPGLVKRIVAAGHELASHGYNHQRATSQSKKEFTEDVVESKKLLEDISGLEVKGYRAPSYSIGAKNLWALDILKEAGYKYSSSIYPIKHDLYGMPGAPRFRFRPNGNNGIVELPVTTVLLFSKKLPCGGGGFFRLYPYSFSRWALQRVNKKDKQSGIFYFHPWEIDPKQPRQKGISFKSRFRHYLNLEKMKNRIIELMKDFSWDTMDNVFLESVE